MNFKRFHESKNLFDASAITTNRYISNATGELVYYSKGTLCASDYIDISGASYVFISYQASSEWGAFYDANKVFISGITGYSNAIQIPNNAKYICLTVLTAGLSSFMVNLGSEVLPYEPYSSEVWHDIPHYIHNTSTDTITTPADIYANDTTATVRLKGQAVQSSVPSPTSPIQPQECGDLETEGTKAGQYKIPILNNSQTTNVYLGEVETTRQVKKLVLTGDENWVMSVLGGHNGFLTYAPNTQIGATNCICSHYKVVYSNTNNSMYFIANPINGRFVILDDRYSSSDDFKSYLAAQYANGTPVTVWYVLATPETAVVNEPLRKIGDYADEVSGITIPVIAGANTLSVDTTLQPSEVGVNYKGWHPVADVHEAENGAWT